MTVGDWLSAWLALRSGALAARTIESYRGLINRQLQPLAAVDLDQLQPQQVAAWLAGCCAAGSRSAQLALIVLRSASREAVESGLIAHDPTARIRMPRHQTADPRYWTLDETKRFIGCCPGLRWGIAWQIAIYAGLRRGEIAGLRWADVDFMTKVLHIRNQRQRVDGRGVIDALPKSAAGRRDVPICDALAAALRQQQRSQAAVAARGGVLPVYVVSYHDNRPIDPHALNRALSDDLSRCHCRSINLHGLRHTMATIAVSQGVDIKTLQTLLGHAQFSTTADIYAHVFDSAKKNAIDLIADAVL